MLACYEQVGFDIEKLGVGHKKEHRWNAIELPDKAAGFAVHHVICQGCKTRPIIGYRFSCAECHDMNFCKEIR
jgi:hypothetical protein